VLVQASGHVVAAHVPCFQLPTIHSPAVVTSFLAPARPPPSLPLPLQLQSADQDLQALRSQIRAVHSLAAQALQEAQLQSLPISSTLESLLALCAQSCADVKPAADMGAIMDWVQVRPG
jgi:hypothetical protein